jgi:hypothetical protein
MGGSKTAQSFLNSLEYRFLDFMYWSLAFRRSRNRLRKTLSQDDENKNAEHRMAMAV